MDNFKRIYLFPYETKILGILLAILGIILGVFRFYFGIKPEYLEVKVFAVYSSFLESKYLSVITNNISEEITGLILLAGLTIIAFSEEKFEDETIMQIRMRSLFYSVYANIFFTCFAFVFIFGLGFIYFLVLNIFLQLFVFILFFRYKLYEYNKSNPNL